MFSGMAFLVDNKMCVNAMNDEIMVRVAPEDSEELLQRPGCSRFIMNGKPMKGYLTIKESALTDDRDLDFWIAQALAFNPRAKKAKK